MSAATRDLWKTRTAAALLATLLAGGAAADYSVQDNIAFNARKINPYTGGPAWEIGPETKTLFDDSLGPVTIGPLNADPLGLALEALFGVDLPHIVKLQTGASLSGQAKLKFGYYVTAGRLDISYPASANLSFETEAGTTNVVRANHSYDIDGGMLPGVSQRDVPSQFLQTQGGAGYATAPLRSQTAYQQPWFETQSPWASAWIEASANIQSSIFTKASALGGLKEWRKDIQAGGKVGGRLVEIDPNGLYVAGEEVVGFDLTEPIGPIPIAGGAADLTIQVPNIAVSSVANGEVQGSVIHARKVQPLVTLTGNLERAIPFVGTILQNQIGPLGYDLLNLKGGPRLNLYQDMTFTPDPKVRLTFSEPVLVGAGGTPTLQAEFDLDQPITWKPMFSNSNSIQVTPTYLLRNTFRNETGLSVDFVIDSEALSLTGNFPPFNGTLGPLDTQHIEVPLFPGGSLFTQQFDIPLGSVTGGSLPGLGPITTGAIQFQKSNLDIAVGLGDMQLLTADFVGFDQSNQGYEIYDLKFTRATSGGQPRLYEATASGLFTRLFAEGSDDDDGAACFVTLENIFVTDPITAEQLNLGNNFVLDNFDQSAFLPQPSPVYPDPNPGLGKLYVTKLPDDLSFVPNVDLNLAGHPQLDQYNANNDVAVNNTVVQPTEFIDRAAYPSATVLMRKGSVIPEGIGRFNGFNSVVMNEAGDIAYSSSLSLVPAGASTSGFYFPNDAGTSKLARAGDPIPGATGTLTFFSGQIALNDVGQAALLLGMSNSFSNSLVVRSGPDGLKVLARNGQAAPSGGIFQDFGTPVLNNSGHALFWGRVVRPSLPTEEVLYVSDGAALSAIARMGDPAPGMLGVMSGFGYYSLNNSGQASFDVATTANVQGLYLRDANGALHLIAADGAAVPQGGEFVGINDQELNDAGQVAFAAGLRTFPGGPLMLGLFRGGASSLVQIAREGQLAPDGDGTLKNTGLFAFHVNDAGQVAFRASIDAATDYQAILVGDGNTLKQIARHGTPAPDGSGPITLLSGVPQLNNHGHVAFDGVLPNAPDEERSVFLYDGLNIVQVVRVGQPLAGSTVIGADAAGINEDMQVAYRASLADGRSVVARFEPSIYWSKDLSGNWGTASNWSLGIEPRDPYDVHIVAENAITVAGPNANRTVKSLTLGADDSPSIRLHLASGVTLTATNGTTIRRNGVLTGHGTLAGSLTNEGVVSPGSSPGTLSIDGDFTQQATGTLVIEMASATEYDRLFVSGDVTLGGTLAVSLLNGFIPVQGQQFSIFGAQFDSLSGAFQSFAFPTFNGLTFAASQSLNSLVLQVVEAPVPGDFNGDGFVNSADLAKWKTGFGKASGATRNEGDDNGDGDVDGADFLVWQRQFGVSSASLASTDPVPEPTTFMLAVLSIGTICAATMSRSPPLGSEMSSRP